MEMMTLKEVVSLEYRVSKAFEGKYFMGHTPGMSLNGLNAWAGLVNPKNSGISLFINTFTVSNNSDTALRAELWVNAAPGRALASPFVSPSNTAIMPPPVPKAQLIYQPAAQGMPAGGSSLFSRVAHAQDTVVGNYYGKIVIPSGGSLFVLLYAPPTEAAAEVAFGWWEERGTGAR